MEVERALVGTIGFEFDNPVLSDLLVLRMTVNMLALRMIDSGNLCSVELSIPRVTIDVKRSASTLIKLLSLILANFLCV